MVWAYEVWGRVGGLLAAIKGFKRQGSRCFRGLSVLLPRTTLIFVQMIWVHQHGGHWIAVLRLHDVSRQGQGLTGVESPIEAVMPQQTQRSAWVPN